MCVAHYRQFDMRVPSVFALPDAYVSTYAHPHVLLRFVTQDWRWRMTPVCIQTGMTVWHHERKDDGDVVELHGNVKHLVCPSCEHVAEARPGDLALLKKCLPRMCPSCHKGQLRFKIMLYDDHESDKITPENVYERLEDDCAIADLIIWVGISFEQVCSNLHVTQPG